MSGRTVLFFSCEPGGAEVLIPVVRLLERLDGFSPVVLSYGLGATRFSGKGVAALPVDPVQKGDISLFERYRPALVITSATSLPERDMSEKFLWHNARLAGVPTLAFLDQWQNYAPRFSGVSDSERLAYLPDYISCIDEVGEEEMVREGFPRERLVKLGHPYLSALKEEQATLDPCELRRRLNILPGKQVALFVSEAIREHYGRSRGYDQYDAFRLFLSACEAAGDTVALVKVHPKDAADGYREAARRYGSLKPLLVGDALTPAECLTVADRVYGMTSIMLIEAYVLGKMVVSLQPGLCIEDPLMLSRRGLIERVGGPKATGTPNAPGQGGGFSFSFSAERFLRALESLFGLATNPARQPRTDAEPARSNR